MDPTISSDRWEFSVFASGEGKYCNRIAKLISAKDVADITLSVLLHYKMWQYALLL